MATEREDHTASVLSDGTVLVSVGKNNNGAVKTSELYHPASRTWETVGTMHVARYRHTASVLPSGAVFVTAGVEVDYLRSVELYNATTREWANLF